jgi:hypothetical protein
MLVLPGCNGKEILMLSKLMKVLVVLVIVLLSSRAAQAEPLAPHPAAAPAGNRWNIQMGRFGESLVRELHKVRGEQVFNLNVGEHGIDGLVRTTKLDGTVEYRVIEVKTLQNGTDFQLKDTKAGKQLSAGWIEDRLATAAKNHADAEARKAAEEALRQFRKSPASFRAELHGVSVADNRYIVKAVDPVSGAFKSEIVNSPVKGMLEELAQRAKSDEVRRSAVRQLAEYDHLQAAAKPRVVKADSYAKQLGELAGVEEKQMGSVLAEASEHIRAPGQSRWVKVGDKVFKLIGKVAGPAGVVIGAVMYSAEAAEIEQKFEWGELTREQADAEQAKLAVTTATAAGGGLAGLAAGVAIGSFICPGPGMVIGGIVGAVGGYVGAEIMMAATGLADTLGQYLRPGVEPVRQACAFVKEKGIAFTVAAREQVREWLGAEAYDQTVAALDSAASWAGGKAVQAGTTAKDAAVFVKDKTVEGAIAVGDAVSDGANWSWSKAKSGWGYLRRQFE